jgi:predicted esterase
VILLFAVPAEPQRAFPFQELVGLFQYDRTAPLDIRIDEKVMAEGAIITTLSYLGGRGTVPAFLVTPQAAGRHPAIVFVHDLSSKKDQFLAEAILLAKAPPGAVSLLIDAPPARPAGWRRNFNPQIENNDRDLQIQAILDVRRGIDLLVGRQDVDGARIAFVGHGEGANWGAVLMSIEPRFRAFVLVAGMISAADEMRSDSPEWADMRYALGKEGFERYLSSIAEVDPIQYVGHSLGAPPLLQFGRFDPYVSTESTGRFAVAIRGQPIWYNAGHLVNDPAAQRDRSRFLLKHIGIGAIKTGHSVKSFQQNS